MLRDSHTTGHAFCERRRRSADLATRQGENLFEPGGFVGVGGSSARKNSRRTAGSFARRAGSNAVVVPRHGHTLEVGAKTMRDESLPSLVVTGVGAGYKT
jgi:hypothetical protein